MRFPLPSVLLSLAAAPCLLLAAPPASQAWLVYSAAGSSISGSLGGLSFTDASWSLTATADEALSTLSTFTTGVPRQ